MVGIREMTLREWEDVPVNPRQRNTESHANYARKNHLAKFCQTHAVVHAAEMGGRILCKLDGHTRSYMWKHGMVDGPPNGKVSVVLHSVSSLDDAKRLYETFDGSGAVEGLGDKCFGALRDSGVSLHSPALRNHKFTLALKMASGITHHKGTFHIDVYGLISQWRREIEIVDAAGLKQMHGGLLALTFALVRVGEVDICDFIAEVLDNKGSKTGNATCGVFALTEHIKNRRIARSLAGGANMSDLFARGLTAFRAWKKNEEMSVRYGLRAAEDCDKLYQAVKATIDYSTIIRS